MHVMLLFCWILVLFIPVPGFTAPTFAPDEESTISPEPQVDLKLATDYLKRYYHLQQDPLGRVKLSGPLFVSKVKNMQMFFGLNVTGVLDSETLEIMRNPRCGVPDVEEQSHTQQTRWNKKVITYSINRYTSDLPRSTVDSLIGSALNVWARASGLTFLKSNPNGADIMVEFVTNAHGDLYPFDGTNGTLAHAFGPGIGTGGDTHFDDDEHWTAGQTGLNLLVIAAHEFGHALGLKHSKNPESLMYPTYKTSREVNLLSTEDVANVNALYVYSRCLNPNISPKNVPLIETGSFRVHPNHALRNSQTHLSLGPLFPRHFQDLCSPEQTFDAVTTLGDATIFFRGRYLWIKHNALPDIKEGPITNFMPKIETGIDAAFWVPRRSTAYLIHESMFWTVKGSVVKGKPRSLTHFGFPPWVQDVDAALHISKIGRTLFFMHDIYWSYNENRKVMDPGYPKYIIEDFPDINSTIDAAFYKEDFIYFFIGPQIYKFDFIHRHMVGIETANSWFGC